MKRWLILALVAACSASAKGKHDDLDEHLRDFQEGLRWRNYDRAAAHVRQEEREKFLDAHEILDENLRIDDYEIERVTLGEDGRRATVRVRYVWHLDSEGRVHDTLVDESWEKQAKVWRIVGSSHRRGEPLPSTALPVE